MYNIFRGFMLLLRPTQHGSPPDTRRGARFRCLLHCFSSFFKSVLRKVPVSSEAFDTIFPPLRYESTPRDFIAERILKTVESAELASEAVVESINLYCYNGFAGHAIVIIHLQHPSAFRTHRLLLSLERVARGQTTENSTSSSASLLTSPLSAIALDKVKISAVCSDETMIGSQQYHLCHRLTFPDKSPTLINVLTLARLVSDRNPGYTLPNRSCIFYVTTVYQALKSIFDGTSVDGPAYNPALPSLPSFMNNYKAEIDAIIATYPAAQTGLKKAIDVVRVLASHVIGSTH
jgi:hypothetical protein